MKVSDALTAVRKLLLDSPPIIYFVEGDPKYQALVQSVFQELQRGAFTAITTPITLAECLVQPYRRRDIPLIERFRATILHGVNTEFVVIDNNAERAAELRARYNLTFGRRLSGRCGDYFGMRCVLD